MKGEGEEEDREEEMVKGGGRVGRRPWCPGAYIYACARRRGMVCICVHTYVQLIELA